MAGKYTAPGFSSGRIMIPAAQPEKWAVIACDQFTSTRKYWDDAERIVGDAPSALRITLPEIYLPETEERIPKIRAAMAEYAENGALKTGVEDGFILVARQTLGGLRLGLVGLIDLDEYEYTPGAKALVRPTEGTIPERVPPRARIRKGALMELPHVMMLIDDAKGRLIESLYAKKDQLRVVYDFELMLGGGHITGYAVEGGAAAEAMAALRGLYAESDGLLYAVGDGNHSLAAAKSCWMDIKKELSADQAAAHPARYSMVELVNIHCPALVFEPIYRIVKNATVSGIIPAYENYLKARGVEWSDGSDVRVIGEGSEKGYGFAAHPLADLQDFLQEYVSAHPETELDYIHGEDELRRLAAEGGVGFMLRVIDKSELFGFIRERGVLPRKAFSMGEAQDKRYYMEARFI